MSDTPTARRGRGGRDRILAAAARLFATHGIVATRMEHVAADAPVSKRTLYQHFPTKDDLVLAYLHDLVHAGRTIEARLVDTSRSPRERLDALFTIPVPSGGPVRGCLILDAAAEYPDPTSAVHGWAREQKTRMHELTRGLLEELGVVAAEELAHQLVTLSDGAAARAMVLDDADYGRHARAAAAVLLEHAGRP